MLTQTELEKYLWGAATTLRGTIDAGDYKQYIFPLDDDLSFSDAGLFRTLVEERKSDVPLDRMCFNIRKNHVPSSVFECKARAL